jgi:hypothetical protein
VNVSASKFNATSVELALLSPTLALSSRVTISKARAASVWLPKLPQVYVSCSTPPRPRYRGVCASHKRTGEDDEDDDEEDDDDNGDDDDDDAGNANCDGDGEISSS